MGYSHYDTKGYKKLAIKSIAVYMIYIINLSLSC